jgi:outer membrane receptor protein involved in Fe transport
VVHKGLTAVTAAWFAFAASHFGVAGELGESAADPSAFTTVIDARAYDDRFATVEELLEQAPGVRVRRFGGLGAYSTASIRGSKSEQVLVLLDGVRMNTSTRGAFDLSTLPLRQVERIEVIRGGGAARYGSDAVGGVISITTRRPESAEPAVDAALTGGSHETFGGDVSVSGGGERAQGLASYARLSSENDFRFELPPADRNDGGQGPRPGTGGGEGGEATRHRRANADFARDNGLLRGTLATGARSRLDATLDLFHQSGGEPGATWQHSSIGTPDERLSCASSNELAERALGRLAWQSDRLFGGAFELGGALRAEKSELEDPDGACGFVDPIVTGGRDSATWREQESTLDSRWLSRSLVLGGVELSGGLSGALRYASVDASDADVHRRTTGLLSATSELSFLAGRLRVFPAVGFEMAQTSDGLARTAAFQPLQPVSPSDQNGWLPALGAIGEVAPGLRVKANWKRVFRRPSFTELFHPDWGLIRGNPELANEKGWNADVGVELASPGTPLARELRFEVDFFQRELDEGIEWLKTAAAYMPVNTGRSRAYGIETALGARLFERLSLTASYTWTDARYLGVDEGDPAFDSGVTAIFPHTPEHAFESHAALRLGAFEPWVDARYETEVSYGIGRETTSDDAFQLDAGVIVRAFDHFALSVEASNLTREQRFDSLGQPLPKQTLWLVRVRGNAP